MNLVKFIISALLVFLVLQSAIAQSKVKSITVSEFLTLTKRDTTIQVIDVRTPQETALGQINKARNIVWDSNFSSKLSSLDKTKAVVLYCKSGNRSAKAAKVLVNKGFTCVYDLSEGYVSYSNEISN